MPGLDYIMFLEQENNAQTINARNRFKKIIHDINGSIFIKINGLVQLLTIIVRKALIEGSLFTMTII